ncbi:MAG: hypothetical protein PHW10_05825 [Candidatus Peribacteraceae bacterium]|nr:hypothetical protein [Candidatus Peribacteraceae bacterium]
MDWKKNFPLILGLVLPVVMVLFIAGSILVPRFFANPAYGFLFTWGQNSVRNTYDVQGGRLILVPVSNASVRREAAEEMPRLFRYDPLKDESEEISFADAQRLTLSKFAASPDGYVIRTGNYYNDGIFSGLFYGGGYRDYNAIALEGHGAVKRITVSRPDSVSIYNFRFVGWILP